MSHPPYRPIWLSMLMLFGGLIVTGPCTLMLADVFMHGLTQTVPSSLIPTLWIYSLWCGVALLRSRFAGAIRWWEYVVLFLVTYTSLVVGDAVLPPLWEDLPAGPTFKEDGLQAIIVITYVPWLLVQYVVFIAFYANAMGAIGHD